MSIMMKINSANDSREDLGFLFEKFQQVRQQSEKITSSLLAEDCIIQSMPDVSPPKWHLAHTTWFFETFILASTLQDYSFFHPDFGYLFNSYYKSLGKYHPRSQRGLLSRPPLEEIYRYRHYVDEKIENIFKHTPQLLNSEKIAAIELGLHHEQQHQELLLTDIKHIFYSNPLRPIYQARPLSTSKQSNQGENSKNTWIAYEAGLIEIGDKGERFSFDNERPRHRVFLESFELASRLVSNAEYLEFIQDAGYQRPELWLSDGWDAVLQNQWQAPLYWEKQDESWQLMTLSGMRPLEGAEPVCHLSHYEADAYARWAQARLPSEAEWEYAAQSVALEGNFLENEHYHPQALGSVKNENSAHQLFGDVWEWTQSAYLPYPGFQIHPGALGEYNGKFMSGQMVLRGGSCLTPRSHIRASYRNFFPPSARWQCTGLRLARNL